MGGTDALSAQAASKLRESLHSEVSYKRLEAGRFKWPPVTDGVVRLSALQLSVLLSGLPWERLQAPPIFRPRAAC
jgi:transposase